MGIRCTKHGKELGAQTKSLIGDVTIKVREGGRIWYVYSKSEQIVLFSSPYRDDCEDYIASMHDLFRLVATHPWRKTKRRVVNGGRKVSNDLVEG